MTQNNKSSAKLSNTKVRPQKSPISSSKKQSVTLWGSFDNWFEKNSKILLIVIFGISILFSLLMFQSRMDTGGDDSTIILRAYDFVHNGIFPSYQGPLYSLFLSVFVSFLGINIIFLKFLSIICNFIALLFFYKSFRGRVPAFVLYSALFLVAINTSILNYASLTYSEIFFMALQSVFFFYFFKLLDKINNNAIPLSQSWKNWLFVGLFIFLMTSARSIGIVTLGGVMLYFAIRKQYRYILYLAGAFLVFYIPDYFIERIVWHTQNQFSLQTAQFLQKNYYYPNRGNEDFEGFIIRFFQNCDLYLSKRFFQIIGLRSWDTSNNITGLTFLFVLFSLFSIYRVIKSKNTYLLAMSVYTLSITALTFLIVQTQWDQPRLIMVYVPLYLMLFIYGLYDALKKSPWVMQLLGMSLVGILILFEFSATAKKTQENLPILSKNLQGDMYSGFTPDWVNYLELSNWCENLPKDSLVACRKGPMSSVYANGRPFVNIIAMDTAFYNADSVIAYFKRNHVRYAILAKIRTYPSVPSIGNQGYVNTMDWLLAPVARKYPQMLKLIRQEGSTEEARLFEIKY